MFTFKGVACEPPKSVAIKAGLVEGADFKTLGLATQLQPLKVLFPTEIPTPAGPVEVISGEYVFVATAKIAAQGWVKEKFIVDGLEFVIVPYEVVFAVKAKDPE